MSSTAMLVPVTSSSTPLDAALKVLGDRTSRKVCNATVLRRTRDGVAVRLWDTDIVTYMKDDSIVLDADGWTTVTTRNRMNRCVPMSVRVYQRDHSTYVSDGTREVELDSPVILALTRDGYRIW